MESERALGSFAEGRRRGASRRPGPLRHHPREGPSGRHQSPRWARTPSHWTHPVVASTPRSPHWWIPRGAPSNSSWIPATRPTSDARTGSRILQATGWWPTRATIPPLSVTGSGMTGAALVSPPQEPGPLAPRLLQAPTPRGELLPTHQTSPQRRHSLREAFPPLPRLRPTRRHLRLAQVLSLKTRPRPHEFVPRIFRPPFPSQIDPGFPDPQYARTSLPVGVELSAPNHSTVGTEPVVDFSQIEADASGAELEVGESALKPVVHRAPGDPHAVGQSLLVDVGTDLCLRFEAMGFLGRRLHTPTIRPSDTSGCVNAFAFGFRSDRDLGHAFEACWVLTLSASARRRFPTAAIRGWVSGLPVSSPKGEESRSRFGRLL
jgi:hypothetical protein